MRLNKYHLYLCLVLFTSFALSCKKDEDVLTPDDTYVKYFGNAFINEAKEIVQTSDGGFIFAGHTESSINNSSSFVVKVASNGNEEWSKVYTSTENEHVSHITKATDGGYLLSSNRTDVLGNQTVLLTKINSTGGISWQKSYFENDSTSIEKVLPTSDGGYLMLGNTLKADSTNGNLQGNSDIILIKTNVTGDVIWSKQYGGIENDYGYDVEEKISNGYILTGSTTSFSEPNQNQTNLFVVEINLVGTEVGKFTYGGTGNDVGKEIEVVSDGYIICGETESAGAGSKDIYYLKIGINIYDVIFEKYFGGSGNDIGYCLTPSSTGFLIGGSTESFGNGLIDAYLISVDGSGNERFNKTYGNSGEEKINDIISLSDNKIIILGTNKNGGNQQIMLIKTKEDGELN